MDAHDLCVSVLLNRCVDNSGEEYVLLVGDLPATFHDLYGGSSWLDLVSL